MDKQLPPNSNERKRRDEIADVANEIEWQTREALEIIHREGSMLRDEMILILAQINMKASRLQMLSAEGGANIRPIERPMKRLKK